MPRHRSIFQAAPSRRHRLFASLCYFAVLSFVLSSPLSVAQPALASVPAAPVIPLRFYAYATPNSVTGYDLMVSDGVNKDRRIARVKVDSLYFTDVTARLSADATHTVFRVTGDRYGGSSLYNVNVATGTFGQITASKNNSEGIGAYAWSPVGNTLAYVRSAPALDPALMDNAYGTIHVYSVGFEAVRLKSSNGNDRLLGFTGDGLGVYAARRETVDNVTLEHLVYLPLTGASATIMIKSRPGLRYSNYAILAVPGSTPKVAFIAEGDFALAAKNSNIREVTPGSPHTIKVESRVEGTGDLVRPTGLGLMSSDTLGLNQVLLRRDAEDYAHISWAPDGSGLLVGSNRGSWLVGLDGSRVALGTSVSALRPATYSPDGTFVVMSDNPATRLVTLDYSTGKVSATKYVGVAPKPAGATVRMPVPYIHQVNDTAAYADGDWACGPTSVVMTLAYYGKLDPWDVNQRNVLADKSATPAPTPETTRVPTGADYAPYVTAEYTHNGHTYSATARDPSGNRIAGLYGTICPTGTASWSIMSEVLSWHGLDSQRVAVTWDGIVAALKRGHPVLLGNKLTAEGHILVVIGYTDDGNLVVNDPYGDKFAPGYGSNDGNGILYPWKRVTPRTAVEVIGTYPPPTATPAKAP